MNIDDNMNMSPSEKLNMLLDGETSGVEPSEVFYELSNSPELQQEFLDIVKLKQLMNGAMETPPEELRRGILAGIGLGGSGLWYYLQNSGAVLNTVAFVSSKVGVAILAVLFGAFSTMTIMNSFNDNESSIVENKNIVKQIDNPATLSMEIPTTSSYEQDSPQSHESTHNTTYRNIVANNSNEDTMLSSNQDNSDDTKNITISQSNPIYDANASNEINLATSKDLAYNQDIVNRNQANNERSGFIINPTNRISELNNFDRELLFSLQGKGISNSSLQAPDLSTTEAPAINDIGISLMYLVSDNLEVGLEFGQEFLVKKVKSGNFSSQESIFENQLTFWGGFKANYTFNELEILPKLRPTTSILLGGTNRGWITKASAGLIYDISNKLAVFAGPEWTTGLYKFNSELLATHKWGFNYGMAIKF